jgi:hypothetical protein
MSRMGCSAGSAKPSNGGWWRRQPLSRRKPNTYVVPCEGLISCCEYREGPVGTIETQLSKILYTAKKRMLNVRIARGIWFAAVGCG